MRSFLLSAILALLQGTVTDWPQFLGPERNGVYLGPALAESWSSGGPRVVWKKEVGQGFSGPVVTQGRVILFHRVADQEVVESLDARTGNPQWRYAYPTSYRDDFGFDPGPRAAPVVAGDIVYTFGAEGQLHAVSLASGKKIWSEDTMRRFGVAKGFFGAAGSPLVEDGKVIANIGGRGAGIVAFDAKTGKVLWKATDDEASYSSPAGATIGGRRSSVFLTRARLIGLDPATGQVQFQRPWRARQSTSVNAATPLIIGDLNTVLARLSSASTARTSRSCGHPTKCSRTITQRVSTATGICTGFMGVRNSARVFARSSCAQARSAGVRTDSVPVA
ncbi:MAG: alcohol dehydrogenase [Acidobacteria bacterium]|nr:MAG: alcohol dehydrogenase [Acidobacteriota bacterium]